MFIQSRNRDGGVTLVSWERQFVHTTQRAKKINIFGKLLCFLIIVIYLFINGKIERREENCISLGEVSLLLFTVFVLWRTNTIFSLPYSVCTWLSSIGEEEKLTIDLGIACMLCLNVEYLRWNTLREYGSKKMANSQDTFYTTFQNLNVPDFRRYFAFKILLSVKLCASAGKIFPVYLAKVYIQQILFLLY